MWLCLLPCLPLQLTWWGDWAKSPEAASWGNQGPSKGLISKREFKEAQEELLAQALGGKFRIQPTGRILHQVRDGKTWGLAEGPLDLPPAGTVAPMYPRLAGVLNREPWEIVVGGVWYRFMPNLGKHLWMFGDVAMVVDACKPEDWRE